MTENASGECLIYDWNAQTHTGRVRRNNEDTFLVMRFDDQESNYLGRTGCIRSTDGDLMLAVSDGMGGAQAGEYVSQLAVRMLMSLVSKELHQRRSVCREELDRKEVLKAFFEAIHEEAGRLSSPYEECRDMGATLSLVWLRGSEAHFAHVGDSRIYHLPWQGELHQVTDDHTPPGRLLRNGAIDEREARRHPLRNRLERCIGGGFESVEPQIGQFRLNPGDNVVLCSDGISDGLWDHAIQSLIQNPPPYVLGYPPAERLVKEANEAFGKDNLTAMVLTASALVKNKKHPMGKMPME